MPERDPTATQGDGKRSVEAPGTPDRLADRPHEDAARLREEIAFLRKDRDALKAALELKDGQVSHLTEAQADLHRTYQASTSWRITAPLRFAIRLLKRVAMRAEARPPSGEDTKEAYRAELEKRLARHLDGRKLIDLPVAEALDVSIVVIAYNQPELLLACLESIRHCLTGSKVKVETIVWDNGSGERTGALLDTVSGVNLLESKENLHFLRGVNRAVEAARGRHLLLLNSDAELTEGSLEQAVARLDADPTIGAVGGRLVLPDGRLQEAGSIVWNDGSCVAYGAGASPDRPEFMFRRDVDYCSGAFLVTPRPLFLEMGGFDERYAPAYYEETDYCVRLWKRGYRVAYDPAILTRHFEFGSSTQVETALDLQAKNKKVFRRTHRDWLDRKYTRSDLSPLFARESLQRPKVLFIDDRVPHAGLGSGYPRASAMIGDLTDLGASVTLFPMSDHGETWPEIRQSVSPEVEVMRGSNAATLDAFLSDRKGYYDLAIVSRPHNMREVDRILSARTDAFGDIPVIYDAEAIFARRDELAREVLQLDDASADPSEELRSELALTRFADVILTVSDREREIFVAETDKPVRLLSHPLRTDATGTAFEDRPDIVFLGPAHDDDTPNSDSLRWFCSAILPEIRARLGKAIRLKVIGKVAAPSIRALAESDLDLLGYVDDLKPVMEKARLIVIPTRFAAGVPLKAHYAAALGVPIVATELNREQLGWENGRDLLSTADAHGFAGHCCALYEDAALWWRLRNNALERVAEDCSPEVFRDEIASLLKLAVSRV